MILVGIDDTDLIDTPGTNQIARALAAELAPRWTCRMIVRHQLLRHPEVRMTRHNSAAALHFPDVPRDDDEELFRALVDGLRRRCPAGSDPGLCATRDVPAEVIQYAQRCRTALVDRDQAMDLARACGVRLEGLGGDHGGVIGALAAVGLAATSDHGRVVHLHGWDTAIAGPTPAAELLRNGVEAFLGPGGNEVRPAAVDVGKHLRPNVRGGRVVLFVEPTSDRMLWAALRRD